MSFEEKKQLNKEFWEVKKAGQRLLWRFQKNENGKHKTFTPNQNDEIALKSVLSWINRNQENNVYKNRLFAKLYILFLTQGIRHYETTVFEDIPQIELSMNLSKPLSLFYQAFISDFYDNQYNKLSKENTHLENERILKDREQFKKTYNEDYIISKLNEMISEALNRFSNV